MVVLVVVVVVVVVVIMSWTRDMPSLVSYSTLSYVCVHLSLSFVRSFALNSIHVLSYCFTCLPLSLSFSFSSN